MRWCTYESDHFVAALSGDAHITVDSTIRGVGSSMAHDSVSADVGGAVSAGAGGRGRRPGGSGREIPHGMAQQSNDWWDDIHWCLGADAGGSKRHESREHDSDDSGDREVFDRCITLLCVHATPPTTPPICPISWMMSTPSTTSRAAGTMTIATTSWTFGAARAACSRMSWVRAERNSSP